MLTFWPGRLVVPRQLVPVPSEARVRAALPAREPAVLVEMETFKLLESAEPGASWVKEPLELTPEIEEEIEALSFSLKASLVAVLERLTFLAATVSPTWTMPKPTE